MTITASVVKKKLTWLTDCVNLASMSDSRTAVNVRLTEDDHRLLEALSAKTGITAWAVLMRLSLRALAEKEGVQLPAEAAS